MKVLALAASPPGRSPAQRYRIEQWAPYMDGLGVHVELAPFLDKFTADLIHQPGSTFLKTAGVLRGVARSIRRVGAMRRFDVVFVAREAMLIGPALIERLASWMRPVVFDLDDAIWLPQEGSLNSRWRWLRSPSKTDAICRLASHITAGNEFLASHVRLLNPNVSIIPSTIDIASYGPGKIHTQSKPLVVGWTGSHSTVRYLESILPAIAEASRRVHFKLLVVGANVPLLPGLQIECRAWSAQREASDVREMDVGLMPLPDSEWTRGKCAMKALQYMAVGVPPIVSPVGTNVTVVSHQRTGQYASSHREWVEAIVALLSSADARSEIGARGRAHVLQCYSGERHARRLADVFAEVARR